MKCTIYGNRLPRGTQVKKVWEPLLYAIMIRENNFLRKYERKCKACKISVRIKKGKFDRTTGTYTRKKERKKERR